MIDPHCKIGRVRLKGSRKITTRLPKKAIAVALELKARAEIIGQGR